MLLDYCFLLEKPAGQLKAVYTGDFYRNFQEWERVDQSYLF